MGANSKKPTTLKGLRQAFDEVRFGAAQTLNLRESLPSTADATRQTEAWLRQKQAEGAGEVLIITGRGNNSEGGVSPVREAVVALLYSLRRRGVIDSQAEHTAGSFVITLAPMQAVVDAPRRRREPPPPKATVDPPSLDGLDPDTRTLLRDLAERALEGLGIADTHRFLQEEMLKQFSAIAAAVPDGPRREDRLRGAIRVALNQHE
jgi:hypothetical protein